MVSLSNRRKAELKDLATSLGLSSTGMREDLVERIRNHVATSGNSALRAQIREDSPDISTRSTTVKPSSSTSKSSSLTKKSRIKVTVEDDLDDLDDEHPLQEHKVRQFMEHMQGELHQASHLAHQLEDTLHAKFTTGNSAAGRDTVTTTTRFGNRHYADGNDDQDADGGRLHHQRDNRDNHTGHRQHHRQHAGFAGWCRHIAGKLQHCIYDCKPIMMVSRCARKQCSRVQELGSTSTGLVWLTFLFELTVFVSGAHSWHSLHKHETTGLLPCLSFLKSWPDFLQPFFSYYTTLFLLPTLLSQLFNNNRAKATTPSALSFFVFKFALTYFLSQSTSQRSLLGDGGTIADHSLWAGCRYISDVFRYIPQSLGLTTAGIGSVLSLAETIVSSPLPSPLSSRRLSR
ncbi:hypothetical protein BGZ68_004773 [Mortierella alpina]|nr:hypothetical protein BGZ68_004773 [Mortierella alpina]